MHTGQKINVVFGICLIPILLLSPLAYKAGAIDLMASLGGVMLAVAGGALNLVAMLGLVAFFAIKKIPFSKAALAVTALCSIVPIVALAPHMSKAQAVPPIHDITTNPIDPPEFHEVVKRRIYAANDLAFGDADHTAEDMEALHAEYYPYLETKVVSMSPAEAIDRSRAVLEEMGLEVINVSESLGVVEATDTTFWFGFKDDVVVRVRSEADRSIIDVRSVSRVGQSDLGVNAERINGFLDRF